MGEHLYNGFHRMGQPIPAIITGSADHLTHHIAVNY